MSARRFVLLLMMSCLGPSSAEAGPWVPGRWHFYLQLRQSALFADDRYDANGARAPIRLILDGGQSATTSYRQTLTNLFGEVGLAQRLSVLVELELLDAVVQPLSELPNRTVVGVGDLLLGGKVLLFDDEVTCALKVALSVPTGSSTRAIPLGPGDLRTDFVLLVGKAFFHPNLYLAAEVGFRLRSAAIVVDPSAPGQVKNVAYAHEIRYAVQGGYTYRLAQPRRALSAIGIALKFEGSYALAPAVEDGIGILNPIAGSYFKLGSELLWSPWKGLQLTIGGHYFVAGRSIPAMTELALGIGYVR